MRFSVLLLWVVQTLTYLSTKSWHFCDFCCFISARSIFSPFCCGILNVPQSLLAVVLICLPNYSYFTEHCLPAIFNSSFSRKYGVNSYPVTLSLCWVSHQYSHGRPIELFQLLCCLVNLLYIPLSPIHN